MELLQLIGYGVIGLIGLILPFAVLWAVINSAVLSALRRHDRERGQLPRDPHQAPSRGRVSTGAVSMTMPEDTDRPLAGPHEKTRGFPVVRK